MLKNINLENNNLTMDQAKFNETSEKILKYTNYKNNPELDSILKGYINKKKINMNNLENKDNNTIETKNLNSNNRCPSCGTTNYLIKTRQTLAGDEIETIYLTCYNKKCLKFGVEQITSEH